MNTRPKDSLFFRTMTSLWAPGLIVGVIFLAVAASPGDHGTSEGFTVQPRCEYWYTPSLDRAMVYNVAGQDKLDYTPVHIWREKPAGVVADDNTPEHTQLTAECAEASEHARWFPMLTKQSSNAFVALMHDYVQKFGK